LRESLVVLEIRALSRYPTLARKLNLSRRQAHLIATPTSMKRFIMIIQD